MRKPLETAQHLTETGMPRDAADIVVGAIHDVRDEVHEVRDELERKMDNFVTKEDAKQFATKTDIAELRAEMKSDHAQMTIRFMTAVIASTMLNLTAIGIAVSVLVWFFGASGS